MFREIGGGFALIGRRQPDSPTQKEHSLNNQAYFSPAHPSLSPALFPSVGAEQHSGRRGCPAQLSEPAGRVLRRPPDARSAGESAVSRPPEAGRLLCLLSWRSKKGGRPPGQTPGQRSVNLSPPAPAADQGSPPRPAIPSTLDIPNCAIGVPNANGAAPRDDIKALSLAPKALPLARKAISLAHEAPNLAREAFWLARKPFWCIRKAPRLAHKASGFARKLRPLAGKPPSLARVRRSLARKGKSLGRKARRLAPEQASGSVKNFVFKALNSPVPALTGDGAGFKGLCRVS